MAFKIDAETYYDQDEAASLTGMSKANFALWRVQGKGPAFVKLGRRVFYHGQDLIDFLARSRRASTLADPHPRPMPMSRGPKSA